IGIKMLLNEGMHIKKDGATLGVSGIDDVHYYFNSDLPKANRSLTDCPVKILLAHSPESIPEAEKIGFDLYLTGHTHGGQICLPNGRMVLHNSRAPHVFSRGTWHFGKMHGYTSTGTGSSGFPARFNCPPEITLHILRDK
ncbi:metallophosphoesterase, partial [bacterium]|nr:metallophosphoesterase [bacterium]